MIPYGKQEIDQNDIDAIIDVLKSDFLTQGPKVASFEKALCEYTGARHSVSFSSATSALIAACKALELGMGDTLWTSTISFVASANCALHCGANVDFVDIDPANYNICPNKLEAKLIDAKSKGNLPKIVVPVHMGGQSCDMKAIKYLADKYHFSIVEDASHAIGGKYFNRPVGNCEYSDIAIFSFHPVKIITTGEGGAAMTNNKSIASKMRLYCNHGITREPSLMIKEPDGGWYYEQIELGYNFRMPDLLAALGESQLKKVDYFVKSRHELAKRYDERLLSMPVSLPSRRENIYSSFHLYILRIDFSDIELSRKEVFDLLRNRGIGVNVHYIPIHLQPYYQNLGFNVGDFPVAEQYYKEAITIPMFHHMSILQQDSVISALENVLL